MLFLSPEPPPRIKDEDEEEPKKENLYDKLPDSFKTEVLVKSKMTDQDDEEVKQRMEMTRAMSPARLAEIRGFSDFPIPTLRKKKQSKEPAEPAEEEEEAKGKENLYEKLPASLKTECLVRTKVEEDEQVLKERQEMTRSMSPAKLGQIRGITDFPLPTFRKKKEDKEAKQDEEGDEARPKENLYDKLPGSLKTEVLVKSKMVEDDEVVKQRMQMTREMSPNELSQFHGLGDFPVPTLRKKKKEKEEVSEEVREAKSKENLYEKLPASLKTECLVRTKVEEDEQVLKERQEATRSMSPAQLGEIRGFSDIPLPSFGKKRKDKEKEETPDSQKDVTKSKENLYEKLPASLKTECLVRTKVEEDEQVLKERQEMTRAMSPAQLGQIRGFSDIPLPSFGKKNKEKEEKEDTPDSQRDVVKSKENLYDKLPASLKTECLVRTKVEEDEKVLKERQEMTRSMSPAELGEIRGFSDIPLPTLRKKKEDKEPKEDEVDEAKPKESLYDKLPESLKAEVFVKSKVVEDDEVLKERQEMTRAMSPAQLGAIKGFGDFPIPTFMKKKKDKERDRR